MVLKLNAAKKSKQLLPEIFDGSIVKGTLGHNAALCFLVLGEKGRDSTVGLAPKLKGDHKSEAKEAIFRCLNSLFPVQDLSFVLACAALQMKPKRFSIQLLISCRAKL